MKSKLLKVEHFLNEVQFGKLNLTYININSLKKKLDEIEAILLSSGEKVIHLIALTEIRLKEGENELFNIPGYIPYFNNRSDGSGGVALYVHGSLASKLVKSECYSNETNQLKINTLTVSLIDSDTNITVVYCPPKVINSHFKKFIKCIDSITNRNQKTIIVGDMNIDVLRNRKKRVSEYLKTVSENGYQLLNKTERNHATRTRAMTLIDHILSNINKFSYSLSTIDTCISDHKQLSLAIDGKFSEPPNGPHKQAFRTDSKKFNEILHLEIAKTTNHTFDSIFEAIDIANDESRSNEPKKSFNNNVHSSLTDPKLLEAIMERNECFLDMKKFGDPENSKMVQIVQWDEKIKKMGIKNKFNSNKLNNCHDSKIYEKRDEILYNKPKYSKFGAIRAKNGKILYADGDIADEFARYFSELPKTLYNNNSTASSPNKLKFTKNPEQLKGFSKTVTEGEVADKIKSQKKSFNRNADINSFLLQQNVEVLKKPLADAINHIFEDGKIPDRLKKSGIILIYKSGDRTSCSNYRPLSLSQPLAKLVDSFIKDKLNHFIEEKQILNYSQFGFRRFSGNQASAASYLVNLIQTSLDQSNDYVSAIFLDLRKAFESVSHNILLEKLDAYGIRGTALNLLKSYFSNRQQFVDINGVRSKSFKMKNGVQQGSPLGPLLFLLFLNDFFTNKFNGTPIAYADDIVLVYTGIRTNELNVKMQEDMNTISEWVEANKLTINIEKTKCMAFSLNPKPIKLNIFINNKKIDQVDKMIYLGLHLQSNMKWDDHINHLEQTKKAFLSVINRIGQSVRMNVLLKKINNLYCFTYLTVVWGSSATTQDIEKLQAIQDILIIKLFKRGRGVQTADSIRKKHKIMNVKQTIQFEKLKFYFKHKYDLKTDFSEHLLNGRYSTYNRDIGKNAVFRSAMAAFNELDDNLKGIRNFKLFQKNATEFILNNDNN